MKEVDEGRRPIKGRIEIVEERQGCTDEQTKYPRMVANAENCALDQTSWQGKNDSSIQLGIFR